MSTYSVCHSSQVLSLSISVSTSISSLVFSYLLLTSLSLSIHLYPHTLPPTYVHIYPPLPPPPPPPHILSSYSVSACLYLSLSTCIHLYPLSLCPLGLSLFFCISLYICICIYKYPLSLSLPPPPPPCILPASSHPSHLQLLCTRLKGAALLCPVVNYWWQGFPSELAKEAYNMQLMQDQWAIRVAHYTPWLIYWWNTQRLFPGSSVAAGIPEILSPDDKLLLAVRPPPEHRYQVPNLSDSCLWLFSFGDGLSRSITN